MVTCPTCLTEVDDSHAVGIAMLIEKSTSWDALEYAFRNRRSVNVAGLGPAFVETMTELPDDWECQGQEPNIFMIIDVAGRLFKKLGNADSYGGYHWTGPFLEVKSRTEPVKGWASV